MRRLRDGSAEGAASGSERAAAAPDRIKVHVGEAAPSMSTAPAWLETHEGEAPLLLIAPHGGQAGPATRALLHPKVNDLHTADITRELSGRLGAGAIINSGMDRNRLDLNRLSQVLDAAPWMLELIAERLERIMARHARAAVLLVHGWNVIEPRVDLGVGLKPSGDTLRPARGAHVSASENFINGALYDFIERLRRDGIKASFGLRYPGGGANNLLQAFTQRHAASPVLALRRLAALNARGALEAVQLELSVALRLPGRLRARTLDAIAASFGRHDGHTSAPRGRQIAVAHARKTSPPNAAPSVAASHPASSAAGPSTAAPIRIGLEFYDSAAQVGAMASFDLGPGAAGARVMALVGRERIALFTAEGRVERAASRLALGPLVLDAHGGRLVFEFRGPAVVVDDGTAYLSVERALAKAALHDAMELHAEFDPWPPAAGGAAPNGAALLELLAHPEREADAVFGRVTGHFVIAGTKHSLSAVARSGRSFTSIGGGGFRARRMVWAAFPDGGAPHALEARALLGDDGDHRLTAGVLDRGRWTPRHAQGLELEPTASTRPPERIAAVLRGPAGGVDLALGGEVRSFVMLSRPGSAQSRILTSLGFATFRLGSDYGAGMFECSHRSGETPASWAAAEPIGED
jgi:hypothetical protein